MFTEDMKKMNNVFYNEGFSFRLVGGAVRDYLNNKTPNDFDFSTNAKPQQIIDVCEKYNFRYIETGIEHGTITIILDEPYEVTTLRIDSETDGRFAIVEWTNNWYEDAKRRDFTINAMSMDFENNLYDYFNGKNDLQNNVVRFVGDPQERIQEDYLRILRFFRFYCKVMNKNNKVHDDYDFVFKQNFDKFFENVHASRIWKEMEKILVHENSFHVLKKMNEIGFLGRLGLDLNEQITTLSQYNDPILSLSSLVYDLEKVHKWVFKNDHKNKLNFLSQKWSFDTYLDAKKLFFNKNTKNKDWVVLALILDDKIVWAESLKNWDIPTFPINGNDLLEKGYKKSKHLGDILNYVKTKWMDSDFTLSRNDLLEML